MNHWRNAVEIFILWVGIYFLYRAFRATRGARILIGLAMVMIAVSLLSFSLELKVLSWIVTRAAVGLSLAMVIIFQPELRSALARLGNTRMLSLLTFAKSDRLEFLEILVDSVVKLSKKRYGALIAIERQISLAEQMETGVMVKAMYSPELVLTIFQPKTALHDGGVIISQGRISTAGCVFPVSQKELSDRTLGLRHRAGIGLTEESDAVAIIVSEETGRMSVAIEGKLHSAKDREELTVILEEAMMLKEDPEEPHEEQLASKDPLSRPSDSRVVSD